MVDRTYILYQIRFTNNDNIIFQKTLLRQYMVSATKRNANTRISPHFQIM